MIEVKDELTPQQARHCALETAMELCGGINTDVHDVLFNAAMIERYLLEGGMTSPQNNTSDGSYSVQIGVVPHKESTGWNGEIG